MTTQDRLEINWFNVVGASLGAVSSAVVLSTLGAAGTLLGAALGSVCITVGGALYAHTMKVTRDRVAAAKILTESRKARPKEKVMAGGSELDSAQVRPAPVEEPAGEDVHAGAESMTSSLKGLPWKRVAALAGALFAITMGIILAFELSTGRAVSTYTGGTSDSSVGTSFSGVVRSAAEIDDTDTDQGGQQQDQAPVQDGQEDTTPEQDVQNPDPAPTDPQSPAQEETQEDVPAEEDAPAPAEDPA
ncbi:MAG: hypothetical protein WA994_05875, partial [Ornithinimicrobium sp.]